MRVSFFESELNEVERGNKYFGEDQHELQFQQATTYKMKRPFNKNSTIQRCAISNPSHLKGF